LNQGIINDNWYFGKIFICSIHHEFGEDSFQDINEEREGIILSKKEIRINRLVIRKTKEGIKFNGENEIKDEGLNYKHFLEINKNFWSNKRIKKWLSSTTKINYKGVYERIRDKIKYYMDVRDERIFDVVTCWVIGTYCYELFESYGYLYFNGLKESGKSKFKKILKLIGFNGQEASSISEASFFRTIENTKGLLCIDEYERMDTDRKKATDLLLNAGI